MKEAGGANEERIKLNVESQEHGEGKKKKERRALARGRTNVIRTSAHVQDRYRWILEAILPSSTASLASWFFVCANGFYQADSNFSPASHKDGWS